MSNYIITKVDVTSCESKFIGSYVTYESALSYLMSLLSDEKDTYVKIDGKQIIRHYKINYGIFYNDRKLTHNYQILKVPELKRDKARESLNNEIKKKQKNL